MITRRTALMTIAAAAAAPAYAATGGVGFRFYGAENCPPCMAFKRDGLPVVKRSADVNGYQVFENLVARTAEVAVEGSFGDSDPLLRRAAPRLPIVYPPIFFVTIGEEIASVHAHDWRAAMDAAARAATQS